MSLLNPVSRERAEVQNSISLDDGGSFGGEADFRAIDDGLEGHAVVVDEVGFRERAGRGLDAGQNRARRRPGAGQTRARPGPEPGQTQASFGGALEFRL